jgi:hypothetical protein
MAITLHMIRSIAISKVNRRSAAVTANNNARNGR